jgi:hypothetical protein
MTMIYWILALWAVLEVLAWVTSRKRAGKL